ncbi:uncharacterized protein LOC136068516 [Quercus suber]|uniref:uncharacterized protein LOC136068516 n=1 Tax=Quercus suber TaxID=58331 RepID=UPI0032DF3767
MVFDYAGGWNTHLLDTLWAYRSPTKTATGFLPFSLVYGIETISLVELMVPTAHTLQGQELETDVNMCPKARMMDLETMDEMRDITHKRVKKLYELCKAENSEDLVARVYPQINKLFHRAVASLSQSRTSNGLLLLVILQFYLDFGEMVLHDADPSLRTFFRSCLSRFMVSTLQLILSGCSEFSDPAVAEATLDFLNMNKKKLLTSFPSLLPQFFPLLLKLIAWNGEKTEKSFLKLFPGLMSPGSFLPLFPSLVDLPILVVALEKVERSSGSLIGNSIASMQKSTAPEMLLALMDEAYTGSTIGGGGGDSESEDSNTIDVADSLFLDLLKDENDGLAVCSLLMSQFSFCIFWSIS